MPIDSLHVIFVAGLDIPKTIRWHVKEYTSSGDPIKTNFAISWHSVADEHDATVDQYLEDILQKCYPDKKLKASLPIEKAKQTATCGDPFEDLYRADLHISMDEPSQSNDTEPARKKIRRELNVELQEFRETRIPMKDPTEFWRYSRRLNSLRICAKIILSVPVSSASVERLFSEAGILLSKMRKRLSPATMKKLVYIRYQTKYDHMIKSRGIHVDPETTCTSDEPVLDEDYHSDSSDSSD